MSKDECIFCQIIDKEIPAYIVFESDSVLAFLDASPVNPGHTLVVPKEHHKNILDMPEKVMSNMMLALKKVSNAVKSSVNADGITIQMNNDKDAGQVIFHSHFHVIPRYKNDGLNLWPQGEYKNGQAEKIEDAIKKNI